MKSMRILSSMSYTYGALFLLVFGTACVRPGAPAAAPSGVEESDENGVQVIDAVEGEQDEILRRKRNPFLPPRDAFRLGLMPVSNIGADMFIGANPTYDGRGVVIAILDSGLDPALPGFDTTTTGEPKILDARDFSGEGRLDLETVQPSGDSIVAFGAVFKGFGRIQAVAQPPFYVGILRELPLGPPPASDLNDNGSVRDSFPIFVIRTTTGWAVVTDTDGDRMLSDETPVHDFLIARETFTLSEHQDGHGEGPMTFAVNVAENEGVPIVDLFFDNSGHGSHVGGIAAGHHLFGVTGFNGIAPGAQLLGLKIANNARGGLSVTGSMVRAMQYAANFAKQRNLPLVLNLSFGVGNEVEGHAAIDSLVDDFLLRNPEVLMVISASNEGPGLSTVGFPGSAELALSVCATFPGVFSGPRPPGLAIDADGIAEFSSRGGELAKPDLCAPGIAFSNVPLWNTGEEISGGTSMAAPQVSGAAALLQSGLNQQRRNARGVDIKKALIASADPLRATTAIDVGRGMPNVLKAFEWLLAGHQGAVYSVRSLADGGNISQASAAFRREGLLTDGDTIQRFEVRTLAGQPAIRFLLESDQRWLGVEEEARFENGIAEISVNYDARRLRTPGVYTGVVYATPANDTLAGPSFGLVNTVVVPYRLDNPFVEGRDLGPGRFERYFFRVPARAQGLVVEMEPRYQTQTGSLYLLEPTGQLARGQDETEAGGRGGKKLRVVVSAEDLIPGVYEAVVVAPPSQALSYNVRAALPRFTISSIEPGPQVTIAKAADAPTLIEDAAVFQRADTTGGTTDDVMVSAAVIGMRTVIPVTSSKDMPVVLPISVPQWVGSVTVEVELPNGAWSQYTDFGVTLYDSTGFQMEQGPMTYGFGRTEFELKPRHKGQRLTVELFPAFAHIDAPNEWTASVRITLNAEEEVELSRADGDSTAVTLEPGQSTTLEFQAPELSWELPEGYVPWLEVRADPAGGAPAIRRNELR